MPRLFSAKVILFFILLVVLDGTVMPVFQIRSVYPSFLYLFVCYAAFEWESRKTVYVAFWAGLFCDLLGGGLIGLEASILVGLAVGLDFVVQKMEREFPGIYFIITFLFVFFAGVLRLLAGYAGDLQVSLLPNYLGLVAMTALYTCAMLPFFNFLANRWFGFTSSKQYELFR